jgi:hypothetical protein
MLRRRIQAGQDEHETLETLFRNIDLSFARTALLSCFHTDRPGRPPRNPMGPFRTFIAMRIKGVRSLREMTRILDTDLRSKAQTIMLNQNKRERLYKKRSQHVHPQSRRKPPRQHNRRESCQARAFLRSRLRIFPGSVCILPSFGLHHSKFGLQIT